MPVLYFCLSSHGAARRSLLLIPDFVSYQKEKFKYIYHSWSASLMNWIRRSPRLLFDYFHVFEA